MFLQASVILSTGGGEYLTRYPRDQVHPPDQVPPWPGTPPRTGTPPRPGTPPGPGTPPRIRYTPQTRYTPWPGTPPQRACWEIQSTRGRYASYWNAFLLSLTFIRTIIESFTVSTKIYVWNNLQMYLVGSLREAGVLTAIGHFRRAVWAHKSEEMCRWVVVLLLWGK